MFDNLDSAQPDLDALCADRVVDARRLLCPMPIIKAEAAIREMQPHELLSVLSTDPGLVNDLPAWCRVNGHRFLGIKRMGRELTGWVVKGEGR
ncbi:MAG: sulfurtransferase TusA family protein [Magnetococcales bacterium]|nr:sulfurtransferase TusA family protein [Magnetococcales bacterium]MBF0439421.1 sulfurtransferase TusA family protein [Magnetococcales bacterium]